MTPTRARSLLQAGGPLLRATAIVIALTAAVDPAVTSMRSGKPIVSVVAANNARDSALAGRVARALGKDVVVVRAATSAANATVVAGLGRPVGAGELARPVFGVLDDRTGPTVTLTSARAPRWSPSAARVPVDVIADVRGAAGRTLDLVLHAGDLVVDRITRPISADGPVSASFSYVPTGPGTVALHVTASLGDEARASDASADVAVDVRDARWAVLFFDPRPSWMSTFVRRALERDGRFVVTSRVVTSRNVSTDAGAPPAHLDDLAALELFDAVVVGAPEALSERDVGGLEAFMRRRGGGAVLLFDRRAAGAYERLTGVSRWVTDSTGAAVTIASGDSATLRATELAWPARLPEGAEIVAAPNDSASRRPIVWRSAVGAGRLVVSGALDAWRFRDRSVATFDRFWQGLVADAASGSVPAIAAQTSTTIAALGEAVDVTVSVRDAALSTVRPVTATASASVTVGASPTAIRLFPDAMPGVFVGRFVAPRESGSYRIAVSGNGARTEVPLIVAREAAHPVSTTADVDAAWITSRGGRTFTAPDAGALTSALFAAIKPAPNSVTWHPMRSGWWIVPFALLLGGEWYLRRRRGLR